MTWLTDFLAQNREAFRAAHIIAVIAWMAGQLMYPRLLIYRLEAAGNPVFEEAMDIAANRLRFVILNPAIILTWVMGLALFGGSWDYFIGQPWFWAKILLVTALSGIHGYLIGLGKKIAAGQRPVEPKRLRMLNEIPMVIAIFAVIAVVVQPFAL